MPKQQTFFAKPGTPVPAVDPADIQTMWAHFQELKAKHSGSNPAITPATYQRLCTPDADLSAVTYRCGMLQLLEHILEPAWAGGRLTDAALKVAAKMPLQRMRAGVSRPGLPYNLEEFLTRAAAEADGFTAPPA